MAHLVKLGSLTEELISVVTGLSVNNAPQKFNTHRESVIRSLRYSNYARTNQFDVRNQLDGIVEKFSVYNRDPLGEALRQRLDELEARSAKWTPEILQLLLELSDRPAMKSRLEDLDFLRPPEQHIEPRYTWEELAAEDPLLRDRQVWRNIDYDAESSDDEGLSQNSIDGSGLTETTALSSMNDEEFTRAEDFIIPVNLQILGSIQKSQFCRSDEEVRTSSMRGSWVDPKVQDITEMQATREILFMLSGLPTSLFQRTAKNGFGITKAFGLKQASNDVFHGFLQGFCDDGNDIMVLREWTRAQQGVPLLQSLQEASQLRLNKFDHKISALQGTFVAPKLDTVVSIVGLRQELQCVMQPILKLSRLIANLQIEPYSHAFRSLELLYNETCISHMAGDEDSYQFFGELFFDCFQVYLRPIRTWMTNGELTKDDHVFFVSESEGDAELASVWQDRYRLRRTPDGILHAPKFLQNLAARKIFTTGKSVIVLRHLGKDNLLKCTSTAVETCLRFRDVCGASGLVPFPVLFDVAFEKWIQSRHHAASSTLRLCLFGDCGLRTSLKALGKLYFLQDGATTGMLANTLFDKLNAGNSRWNDRFSITELAQNTLGTLDDITADRLYISFLGKKYHDVQRARKTVKSMASFNLMYKLPWPVQIVITKETIPSYQKILTFLLQIRRSAYMLEKIRLLRDTEDVNSGANERAHFYIVRSRLLWFTSTLYSHLTDVVIEIDTLKMHQALTDAEDVDQMIQIHATYIKNLEDRVLLGPKLEPIQKAIISILDLTIKLSDARAAYGTTQASCSNLVVSNQVGKTTTQGGARGDFASSDEEIDDSEADFSILRAGTTNLSYIDQLQSTKAQFDRLRKFISTGLRAVARAGDQGSWDMLAEKLEFGND